MRRRDEFYGGTEVKSIRLSDINFFYRLNTTIPENLNLRHCHDKYEILYVVDGKGKCVVEGREFAIHPRTVMLVRPFAYHTLMLDPDCNYERYVLQFSQASLMGEAPRLLDGMFPSGEDSEGDFIIKNISADAASLFDRFEISGALSEAARLSYTRMLISQIIIMLSVSVDETSVYERDELGAKVIRYLNGNIEKNMSLDKLARHFFVSKYYLCRAFKKHNGISIHGYINQKRIMYAKQLIEEGETASVAAYKVGFGDYSAFYRAYIKIVGKAPTADQTIRRCDEDT